MTTTKPTALITGASKGFGLALAEALGQRGWKLIINARNPAALLKAQRTLEQFTEVTAISGDVRDEIHLLQFVEKLEQLNESLDLVVNNASTLGVSPQPLLLDYEIDVIHQIFHTNLIAPLSLLQKVKAFLSPTATIINLSSDAAAHHYEGWGGYGASKAALDHLSLTLGKEYPEWNIYAFDPGDMRTEMHQAAFPGEDISDRPLPGDLAVPSALHLIYGSYENGRYEAGKIPKLSHSKTESTS
jgi:NAD(P)-dependent dehydrogenase (short-subunit alcohol dehydrogenase family)